MCAEPANGLVDQFPHETHNAFTIRMRLAVLHVYGCVYDPSRDSSLKQELELSNDGWQIVAPRLPLDNDLRWSGVLHQGNYQVPPRTTLNLLGPSRQSSAEWGG